MKRFSPQAAFLFAFALGWVGGCQCTPTGYEQLHYACTTDRDCVDGYSCVGGFCEVFGSVDAGCGGQAEVCDNDVDENCNGVLDDGCPCSGAARPCYRDGLDSPELRYAFDGGAGCAAGTQACVNGTWAELCADERLPQLEFCDGLDTDCDGLPDPVTCPCQAGRACYQGLPNTLGANRDGRSTCKAGVWDCTRTPGNQCVGQVLPSAREVCDGLDDDCNGAVDDQADTAACGSGICADTPRLCVDGGQPACDLTGIPGYSAAEACGDGLDNNCNGQVEEFCSCVLDAGISCWTGTASECPTDGGACKGLCRRGTQRCVATADGGTTYSSCTGFVAAQTENCSNTQDDDCDGLTDCIDPSCDGRSCNTTGKICASTSCQCVLDGGTVQTTESICNDGRDNDCDGLTDCAESACNGQACAAGKVCAGNQCANADGGTPQTSETICNDGFDNDGDGNIDCADQGCNGRTCAPNGFDCNNNQCQCNANNGTTQAVETICNDGSDNDCDGLTDCSDPGCISDAGVCVVELNCGDGADNDLDGNPDCADTDCLFKTCVTGTASVCCGPYPAVPNTATCINTGTDPNNCGGCGTVCPSGACQPASGNGRFSGVCTCPSGDAGQCPTPNSLRQLCSSGLCNCGDDNDRCSKNRGQDCQQITGADFCFYGSGGGN